MDRERRVTVNVEVNVEQDVMDQAKRLLQENLEAHVNCRSSTVPYVEEGRPAWDEDREKEFWSRRLAEDIILDDFDFTP